MKYKDIHASAQIAVVLTYNVPFRKNILEEPMKIEKLRLTNLFWDCHLSSEFQIVNYVHKLVHF